MQNRNQSPEPELSPTPHLVADLVVGGVALLLATAALGLVSDHVASDGLAAIGNIRSPAFFPVLAAGLLALLAIALILRAWRGGALRACKDAKPLLPAPKVLGVAASLALGGAVIFWMGFLVMAALLIAALAWVLGERRPLAILALSTAVPVAIHLLFRNVLNVLLPSGIL